MRDWPTTASGGYSFQGTSSSLVVGSFVPGHDGVCAVVMRDGAGYLSFQPQVFEHFVGVELPSPLASSPVASARQLATLRNHGTGTDRLAAVVAGGVDLWHYGYDPATQTRRFLPVGAGPDANFAGATDIRAGVHQVASGPENHFVAFSSTWAQGAVVLADDSIVAGTRVNVPAGSFVWDVTPIDWVPGGLPEIAALTSDGLFVFDFAGQPIDGQAFPTDRGRICAIDQDGAVALCAVIPSGGQWVSRTWVAASSTTWDSPTFSLPDCPTGVSAVHLTDDGYSEVVVSTVDDLERIMIGTVNGPTAQGGYFLRKHAPTSTLNHTATVIGDLDRDGLPDLLQQCDGSNQLIWVGAIQEQMHEELLQPFSGQASPSLPEPELRGVFIEGDIASSSLPDFSSFPAGYDALILRFTLPDDLPDGRELRVFQYPVVNGDTDLSVVEVAAAAIPSGSQGAVFDIAVPLPLASSGDFKVVLEFALYDAASGTPIDSSSPVFGRYMGYLSGKAETETLLADMLDRSNPLWKLGSYFMEAWQQMVAELNTHLHPGEPDPGQPARYLGGYEATGDLVGSERPAGGGTPLPIPGVIIY
ncbi:MAG: VCBS repeat-containing protein [Planctomycetes bacterium]|nr:VCBS repeat-containing protein [Planctomycetota bacterium]